MRMRWFTWLAIASGVLLYGCDNGGGTDAGTPIETDGNVDPVDPPVVPPANVLPRPSRSTTIDLSPDNRYVAMVNPGDGTLSVFQTSSNERFSRLAVGGEPSAVVIHPDGATAFVANQADATVVRVNGINTPSPSIAATINVGSEPTGLALSPTGAQLFVAEWGQSRVSVINTTNNSVSSSFAVRMPYALAVTNNLDTNETDESLIVAEFYGRPNANGEAKNNGRDGFIQIRPLSSLTTPTEVPLPPLPSGFPDDATSDLASANQLFGVTIAGTHAYVTSISASPERPVAFNRNVHSVVYAIDLTNNTVDMTRTHSLSRLVRTNLPEGGPTARHFLGDVVGLDFIGTNIAYVVSRAADVVQRLDYSANPPTFGTPAVPQIDVLATPAGETTQCQVPTGIVTTVTNTDPPPVARFAYLNCQVTRQLGVVNLGSQSLTAVTESTAIPAGEVAANRGRRFFFTGRRRWSKESWSGCGSCHPGGLSDNITWAFGFGPRQSTSLDGSFSHGQGAVEQRIFNWTANFDEVHDFERNTRDVSGGLGAVTMGDCSAEERETQIDIAAVTPAGRPIKELQDSGCTTNWDDVDAYMRTIRPPRGRTGTAIARGRELFIQGCAGCHGGGGWTVSQRDFEPSTDENTRLTTFALADLPAPFTGLNAYMTHIQAQPAGLDPVAGVTEALAPPHFGCAIRDVATFGIRTGQARTDVEAAATMSIENRLVMGNVVRSLGAAGYNVPSLYGMQLGAPYLHHGQADTLEELLDPAGPWLLHLRAQDMLFLEGDTGADRAALIEFLMSIDSTTELVPVPAGNEICGL